jgi:hypothetical protein
MSKLCTPPLTKPLFCAILYSQLQKIDTYKKRLKLAKSFFNKNYYNKPDICSTRGGTMLGFAYMCEFVAVLGPAHAT